MGGHGDGVWKVSLRAARAALKGLSMALKEEREREGRERGARISRSARQALCITAHSISLFSSPPPPPPPPVPLFRSFLQLHF